ncbi:DUF6597 domain-containing transcriptional factor [Mucilaginibacter sp. UC70_90]
MPLYANGCPTTVFQSAVGKRSGSDTGYLNLYGQTIQPETLMIRQPFTLIAFFMRPHIIQSLFGVSARELTDSYLDLSEISHFYRHIIDTKFFHLNQGHFPFSFCNMVKLVYLQITKPLNGMAASPHYFKLFDKPGIPDPYFRLYGR